MDIVRHQKKEITKLKMECFMLSHNVNDLISCQNMVYSMKHLYIDSLCTKEGETMQQ
jgi:hypothetical protein